MDTRRKIDTMFAKHNSGLQGNASIFFESMVHHTRPHWARQQQTQRVQNEVSKEFTASQKTAELLEDAYQQKRTKNRESHNKRFKKDHIDQKSSEHHECHDQNQEAYHKQIQPRDASQFSTPSPPSATQPTSHACPQT